MLSVLVLLCKDLKLKIKFLLEETYILGGT